MPCSKIIVCLLSLVVVTVSVVVAFPVASTVTYTTLKNYSLSNVTNTTTVQTWSTSACAFICTARGCYAAQYNVNGLCTLVFSCAPIGIQNSSNNVILINSNYSMLSGVPQPLFEWMLTDKCGSLNTGWYYPGVAMLPTYNATANGWTAAYNISLPSSYFGNAVWFPNQVNYYMATPNISISISLSKSWTVFAYLWLYTASGSNSIEILEFSNAFGPTTLGGLFQFWYHSGGVFIASSVPDTGCSGSCGGTFYTFTPPINVWFSVAMVYDSVTQLMTCYYNGKAVWISGVTTFSTVMNVSFVGTGSRGPGGQLPGTIYCIKMYQSALSYVNINNVAKSCLVPSVRAA